MKRIIFIALIACAGILASCNYAYGQGVCPSDQVCISHETANKLFDTVNQLIAAKDLIQKLMTERGTSDVALTKALATIDKLQALSAIDTTIEEKQAQVIALYKSTLDTTFGLVAQLQKMLTKKDSTWKQVLHILERITDVAIGIGVGRVLLL